MARRSRLAGVLVAGCVAAATRAAPLHPRVCDNYAPLLGCRDAPEVALPGLEYGRSKQAYGSVLEGHKPFPLDHRAIDFVMDYAKARLREDIEASDMAVLTRMPGATPRFWGLHLCSARALELRYTVDGVTGRDVDVGFGRRVPVYFGVTLQLQLVSAWHPAPLTDEDAEFEESARRGGWTLGLGEGEAGAVPEHPRQWAPEVWLAHRLDVSYDPSRSLSVQRHTWRGVGAAPGTLDGAVLMEGALMHAGPPRTANTSAGEDGAPVEDAYDAAGIPERLRGKNETEVRVALALEGMCGCAGGASGEDAPSRVTGAGGRIFAADGVVAAAKASPQDEFGCVAAFERAADRDAHAPTAEGTAPNWTSPALKAAAWELLSLRDECAATVPAPRSAAVLVAGTACPEPAEAIRWLEAEPAGAAAAAKAKGNTRLRGVLVNEAGALAPLRRLWTAEEDEAEARAAAGASADVTADGEASPVDEGDGRAASGAAEVCRDDEHPTRCRPPQHGRGRIRVASFNAWNSNPPAWLYPASQERWRRYSRRMDLFASLLRAPLPDIIGLQEIRLDITLGPQNQHGQMRHVAERLPGYQYVAQPATVYARDGQLMQTRDEEGVAIASRFPIVHTDYAVLSRDHDDAKDEHARVCLHAVVSTDDDAIGLVDVYSVHLPLSDAARNRTTAEVERFIRSSRLGAVQLLLGDMNDEPHNATMRFWSGAVALEVANATASPFAATTPFRDAWLEVAPEPEPRSADPLVRRNALTFPSDNPQKRIDAAFFAALPPEEEGMPEHRPSGRSSRVSVEDAWIIGQDPVPGTEAAADAEHVGMVHADSPLWASDHRGTVFDLRVSRGPA